MIERVEITNTYDQHEKSNACVANVPRLTIATSRYDLHLLKNLGS